MPLGPADCYFDVKTIYAGLNLTGSHDVAADVRLEPVFQNNLVAQVAQTAKEVLLGMPSDPDAPIRPIYGLVYRVVGRRLLGLPDDQLAIVSQSNALAMDTPRTAFRRTMALMNAVSLVEAGNFAWEIDSNGYRRLHGYQFNTWSLSVHYDAGYVWDDNIDTVRLFYAALASDYMRGDGRPLGVAIDRLGSAGRRADAIDANLDLCIAAEIAFLFGVKRDITNDKIAKMVRENAQVFFADADEFFWGRDEVAGIIRESYKERSNTVHGRKFDDPERLNKLVVLNARLREVIKATLKAFIERQPSRLNARAAWPERRAALERGAPISQIFL